MNEMKNKAGETKNEKRSFKNLVSVLIEPLRNEGGYLRVMDDKVIQRKRLINRKIRELESPRSFVRMRAADSLGYYGDKRAIKPLIKALDDEDTCVRRHAIMSLAWKRKYIDSKTLESLKERFIETAKDKNEHNDTRMQSTYALSSFKGEKIIDALMELLKDRITDVRAAAAYSLGILRAKKAIKSIRKLLESKKERVLEEAVYALGVLGDEESLDRILNINKTAEKGSKLKEECEKAIDRLTKNE